MTRRLTALLTIALLALAAGCGGGDDGGGSSLDDLLGYLPADAPLVGVVETDFESDQYKNVDRILGRFPFGGQVKSQLKQSLAQSGADYDKDLKPLLGNPIVVGSPDARSLIDDAAEDQYVVVWNVKDGGKFRELIEREGDSRASGEVDGETAYESRDGSVVILKGDTLIGANDRPTLEAAAERQGGDDNLSEDTFNDGLGDLPDDAIVRVYGDAQKLLEANPATATARRIKWVGGLRTFGLTATAEGDGLAVDMRVKTEGVSEQDLPLAPGDEAPAVARDGEWAVGLRNATQLVRFVENAMSIADPEEFEEYDSGKKDTGRDLGIDFDTDVIDQLTGAATITGGLEGKVGFRSEVEDPAAIQKTLDAMIDKGRAGDSTFKEVDGVVESTDADDGEKTYFGLVDNVFVAAQNPAAVKQLAAVEAKPVEGVRGSLIAVADGEAIAKAILQQQGGSGALGGQFFTGAVGDATGWVTTSPDGMRGRVKLKIE